MGWGAVRGAPPWAATAARLRSAGRRPCEAWDGQSAVVSMLVQSMPQGATVRSVPGMRPETFDARVTHGHTAKKVAPGIRISWGHPL